VTLKVVPFAEKHLEDAAGLFCARYRALRHEVPSLPSRYEESSTLLPPLRDLTAQAPAVAATRGGRLVGFLGAFLLPDFRGKRSVFGPEWANAADLGDSRRLYEEMYAHLSGRWVSHGCLTHLVAMLAHDQAGIDGWTGLGFGPIAADGVRDLQPVPGPRADVRVRRASPQDVDTAMVLLKALERHLASPPTFLPPDDGDDRESEQRRLADPGYALWLADTGSEAVACLGQGPASPDACTIIVDDKTSSIVSAFTRPDARGRGVATALLNRALEWARAQGYERCAVDYEPMNLLAARFWRRHFQPVSYAFVRHVDERIVRAGPQRDDDTWSGWGGIPVAGGGSSGSG
jgi:GNAT superfamily N-acetyltransferase